MTQYVPSSKEQAFLETVASPTYNRQLINGLLTRIVHQVTTPDAA